MHKNLKNWFIRIWFAEKLFLWREIFFFWLKKKLVTFSYVRWCCTQSNLRKYANQSPINCAKRNWAYSLFPSDWHLRGCIVMLTLIDKTLLVKFYYFSQESVIKALRGFWTEKKMKKWSYRSYNSCRTNFPCMTFQRNRKFAGSVSQWCSTIVRGS